MTQSANKLDEALQYQFARVSWRLALRLGYADHIELVRSTMMRFMETHYLNNLVDFNEDPTTGEVGVALQGGVVTVVGSFFGSCFLGMERADELGGNGCSTYWGISQSLYMTPVSERLIRLCGVASIFKHNLAVIERSLKLTAGIYDRKKPTVEEVVARVKEREKILQGLTDKSSLFGGKGLIRRHVLGQPVGFASRTPIR